MKQRDFSGFLRFLRLLAIWVLVIGTGETTSIKTQINEDTHSFDYWPPPITLLKTPLQDGFNMPMVYTGLSGNSFAIFSGRPSDDETGLFAIYISKWTGEDWTLPVDVIALEMDANPTNLAVTEDLNGYLHIFWPDINLMHASAPESAAEMPSAWSRPIPVGNISSPLFVAAMTQEDGVIHLAVSTRDKNLTYLSISSNGFINASGMVRKISDAEAYPFNLSIVKTRIGVIHICWVEQQQGLDARSRGYFCSISNTGGTTWSAPEQIASGHRGGKLFYFPKLNLMTHVIWGGNGVGGRYIQISADDGKTWTAPMDLTKGAPMEGFTGQEVLADSSGNLHALLNPGDGRYTHSTFGNGLWSEPVPIGYKGSDWLSATVSRGNRILILWSSPGAIQVTNLKIDSFEELPLPSPAASPSLTLTPENTPQQTPTALPASTIPPKNGIDSSVGENKDLSLSIAAISSTCMLMLICGWVILRRRLRQS